MPSVTFENADSKPNLKNKQHLKRFIPVLFSEYNLTIDSLSIIFCSDEYLLSLNNKFLQHDFYTDILTFDLSVNENITGEIYISIDRVKENALKENIPYQKELQRIIFHGILHLCGLEDKSSLQKKKMTAKENEAIAKFESFT